MIRQFAKHWIPVIIYAGIIFYSSSLSKPLGKIILFPHADKLIHFFEFAFLGLLLRRALLNASRSCFKQYHIFWTCIFGIMYGISDEFHQYFVPGREVAVWDLFCDSIGVLASLWIKIK